MSKVDYKRNEVQLAKLKEFKKELESWKGTSELVGDLQVLLARVDDVSKLLERELASKTKEETNEN